MIFYPSKVLLFGEYTVLNGSQALAVPCEDYQGRWSFEKINTEHAVVSHQNLQAFLKHNSNAFIDLKALASDVDKGLWFDSTIPHGYGVGSSGALIAAIYDSYGLNKGELEQDQVALARLEDHFHGASSGIDPLVSYIHKPILIHDFNQIEVLATRPELKGLFLLNSGAPRQTGPLVNLYKEKMKLPEFKQGCVNVLQRDVNLAIDSLLKADRANLCHSLWHISKFQWDFFREMIPEHLREIWTKGLDSGDTIFKLCGAGGGGFILGYNQTFDFQEAQRKFSTFELRELK